MIVATLATADVFTSKAAFLANVQPAYYEEAFTGVPGGFAQALDFGPVSGLAYQVTAVEGLFNDPGLISTNSEIDKLEITFTAGTVTAIGGNFWATDVNFLTIPANVTIELSDGTVETYFSGSAGDFRGFTSVVPIKSITIDAQDLPADAWATMDNLIVGLAIGTSCYPDCDASGLLNIDDFVCFQTFYAIGDPSADCDESGTLNIDDFICFQTYYSIGC
jgi:hypothetical protein